MEKTTRDWTPAEILMILFPNGFKGRDMLKYTFLDLIVKGVLQYQKEVKDGKTSRNVYGGPRLFSYEARQHEAVLLIPFKKQQPRIPLKLYVRTITQSVGGYYSYSQRYVKPSPWLVPYFKPGFWNILNIHSLNDKGKALQQRFKIELDAAGGDLKRLVMRTNYLSSNAHFQHLGTNILLLEEWDAVMRRKDLEEVGEELIKQATDISLELAELSDLIADTFSDAWTDISDAFSSGADGGSGGDGGGCSSDGGSGCGSSGCGGGGCGGGCGS
ncbi:MAG: hypothetical protein HUU01_19355 [Saprospiraceae bacterium]|nr:hypothetical protein [Saprospiraceae bacterium]